LALDNRQPVVENDNRMSNAPNEFDALTRAVLAVFRAHQGLVADGDRLAGPWRLNSAKWKTLGAIALAASAPTAPQIGRSMGLSRQGAQKQLDVLMQAGLVSRVANDSDARAPLYRLTRKGETVYGEILAAWRMRSAQLSENIDEAALLAAAKTLHEIADAIGAKTQRSRSGSTLRQRSAPSSSAAGRPLRSSRDGS
jgi:DNA-binding MarR family transcriptional regulator